jgi:ELWxxDGT repeat protein
VAGLHNADLWETDGTPAGTVLVKQINANGGLFLDDLTNVNGSLYFTGNDGLTFVKLPM